MTGALPPSSRWVRFTLEAAASSIFLPVPMSPVSEIMSTPGWLTSALPTLAPRPVTTLTTPAGSSSARIAPSFSAVSGVISEGLKTTVLPPPTAGASFQAIIISG